MATTTNYSWTTPDDTAYVKDGASAIRSLGSAVDTTTKALNPSTTLGDVEYRSATANTNTRLAIGTSGQVLTVSGGVPAWVAPVTGFSALLNPKTVGEWSFSGLRDGSNGVITVTEDRTYYTPVFLTSGAFDRIGINTANTHTGTTTVRLGLYNASATTGKPTTVYFDAGTVSCTAASTTYTITITQTPPTGWYYLAFNAQSLTGVASFQRPDAQPEGILHFGSSLSSNTNHTFYEESITGAFATAATLVNTNTRSPLMGLRNA
jgi:hypothetical protein